MAYTGINKSTDYFDTRTYSASGAGSVSDLNFQPDFIWFKNRTIAGDHGLFDAIRGVTKYLISNSTSTGLTGNGTSSDFLSFDTNGYTYGTSSQLDCGTGTPVTWCWKANGAGSSNTDGSITSTVSANTTAGFSIVKYTGNATAGATIGHGLGAVPNVIIAKKLNNTTNWSVYHSGLGNFAKVLSLNTTSAATTDSGVWDNVPTSSRFLVGSDNTTNANGDNYIAYCFAEKTGYSKFGSYVGNASADGTFVYTGFKPAFVIAKLTSVAGENWYMWDNKRSTGNVMDKFLYPNLVNSEVGSSSFVDFLSNGFKLRSSSDVLNGSGNTHIYMAFAEAPLVGTNNVPCTAR